MMMMMMMMMTTTKTMTTTTMNDFFYLLLQYADLLLRTNLGLSAEIENIGIHPPFRIRPVILTTSLDLL